MLEVSVEIKTRHRDDLVKYKNLTAGDLFVTECELDSFVNNRNGVFVNLALGNSLYSKHDVESQKLVKNNKSLPEYNAINPSTGGLIYVGPDDEVVVLDDVELKVSLEA